jgi:hypothetical protein
MIRAAEMPSSARARAIARDMPPITVSKGHAPRGVGLRIEEDLRANDVVGMGPLEIRPCQVVKIVFRAEHRRGGVVDVEKALQVGEGKRPPQRLRRIIGQRDTIATTDLEGQFRLERALDVHMQLRLGRGRDQGRESFGPDVRNVGFHMKMAMATVVVGTIRAFPPWGQVFNLPGAVIPVS